MLQNRQLQLHNTHGTILQVGSPPPTLACPHCPRHFHSKGGRTKHIQAKHDANGLNPHASNVTLPPSPVSSLSHSSSHIVQFEEPPSPIPSDFTPTPPPSYGEADAADDFPDIGLDAEYPQFNQNDIPPDVGDELNEDLPPGDNPMEQHAPNPPHITYIYHPKLNGKVELFSDYFYHTQVLTFITVFRKDLR